MKRGTPNHPKVYDLAERLGVSWATAIGHLELLFHFTAQYCPQGNLGRYSDKRIAAALGWHKSPQVLLESLSGSGWVDVHPEWRWTVHDWHLHCDRTTVQRLSRSGLKPIEPIHKVTGKVCTQAQRETLSPPEPVPEPVPEPTTIAAHRAEPPHTQDDFGGWPESSLPDDWMERISRAAANWPTPSGIERGKALMREAVMSAADKPATLAMLMLHIPGQAAYYRRQKFAKSLANVMRDGDWMYPAPTDPQEDMF